MTLSPFKSSAKSARRTTALTLLGVLGMLIAAGAIYAAAAKEDFTLSVSPSTQTVSGSKSVTSSVTLNRSGGHAKPVALKIAGLPAATTASFAPATVAGTANSSVLTLTVGAKAPVGNHTLTITGTDGRLARTTTMLLAIKAPSSQNFTISASPSSRTVVQGEPTTYAVAVTRSGGFNGPIAISAAGLPNGATVAPFTIPAGATTGVANVTSSSSAATGTFQPVFAGTATLDSGATTRSATVTYVVAAGSAFQISGSMSGALVPGVTLPLNLTLTNPNNFDLKVSSLAVSVEERTSNAGCSGTKNLSIAQVKSARYPITVPASSTRTLEQLGLPQSDWPQVSMLNLPINQDACRGASYNLQYGGTAGK